MRNFFPLIDGGQPKKTTGVIFYLGLMLFLPRLSPAQGGLNFPVPAFRHVISSVPVQPEEINLSF